MRESNALVKISDLPQLSLMGPIPKGCLEQHDIPSKDELRQRIQFICNFSGLVGAVSDATVDFVGTTLQVGLLPELFNPER